MGQTIIKVLIALLIGSIAFQLFKVIIGGLILVTKAIFFIGFCIVAYIIVNSLSNKKTPTS